MRFFGQKKVIWNRFSPSSEATAAGNSGPPDDERIEFKEVRVGISPTAAAAAAGSSPYWTNKSSGDEKKFKWNFFGRDDKMETDDARAPSEEKDLLLLDAPLDLSIRPETTQGPYLYDVRGVGGGRGVPQKQMK